MLLKLLKYDFKANRVTYFALYLALLVLAILSRVFTQTIIIDSRLSEILGNFLLFLYFVGVVGVFIFVFVSIISSFNKSMFKRSGYLTLTLPVSTNLKIVSKLIMASFWFILAGLVLFISLAILIPEFGEGMNIFWEVISSFGLFSALVLLVILSIFGLLQSILVVFLIVTFVHTKMVKGKRLLIGVLIYFVYYYASNIITSMYLRTGDLNFTSSYPEDSLMYAKDMMDTLSDWIHSVFPVSLAITVIITVLCYLGIRYFIDNKIELD